MNVRKTLFAVAAATAFLLTGCKSPDDPHRTTPSADAERIGVYDGRAVVIAYANGPKFAAWIGKLRAEHDAAEAAGNDSLADELEAKAVAQQDRFHAQAFEGDDIDDVLALVADDLPQILAAADVTRLEKVNRDRGADVVTVDVTDRLVELFEPSEKGRKWIADIRGKPF